MHSLDTSSTSVCTRRPHSSYHRLARLTSRAVTKLVSCGPSRSTTCERTSRVDAIELRTSTPQLLIETHDRICRCSATKKIDSAVDASRTGDQMQSPMTCSWRSYESSVTGSRWGGSEFAVDPLSLGALHSQPSVSELAASIGFRSFSRYDDFAPSATLTVRSRAGHA
jgi:hypothetical protein